MADKFCLIVSKIRNKCCHIVLNIILLKCVYGSNCVIDAYSFIFSIYSHYCKGEGKWALPPPLSGIQYNTTQYKICKAPYWARARPSCSGRHCERQADCRRSRGNTAVVRHQCPFCCMRCECCARMVPRPLGLPDLPYFTGNPLFQTRSSASRWEAAGKNKSPVFC